MKASIERMRAAWEESLLANQARYEELAEITGGPDRIKHQLIVHRIGLEQQAVVVDDLDDMEVSAVAAIVRGRLFQWLDREWKFVADLE